MHKGKRIPLIELKLNVVSKGSILALSDATFNQPNSSSVKCISLKGVVKQIKSEDFIWNMKQNPSVW
jgi:hypothetical protein